MARDELPFESFYAAVNGGRKPFPWQARLADRLATGAGWPELVGIPTGLGKTSCLDLAIWSLAFQADRAPSDRTAPTRIWWLVNRRLLVDATYEHARRIAWALEDPSSFAVPDGDGGDAQMVLERVASRLRSLSADPAAVPLEVVRLRGGSATGRPSDPSQPAVILSTLPMYGSRLLFRGYGSSRAMRPIDAALAGTDALVIVDEAHLARHLMKLFAPLADCESPNELVLPAARVRPLVVSLTATGDDVGDRFELDEADHRHPVVRQRLDATKPIRVELHPPGTEGDLVRALVAAARGLLDDRDCPSSVVVFANTPKVARAVRDALDVRLQKDRVEAEVVLLTGQMRERESDSVRAQVLDPAAGIVAGSDPSRRARHVVAVATQTLEVGADVDFERLVTEACGVRALTQRLGRLNRLGRWNDARGVYVHLAPKPKPSQDAAWPVYGTEPERLVLPRLTASAAEGEVDLRPGRVDEVLGEPGDDPGRAPEVMPALLWEWAKTTQPPPGEAPVEPYFAGLSGQDHRVVVCWRAYVPEHGERLWPRLRDEETIDLPIGQARDALAETQVLRLAADRVTVEAVDPASLRPGDAVVLASDSGRMDRYGWAPESRAPVLDVSVLREGLALDEDAIRRLTGVSVSRLVSKIVMPADDDDTPEGDYVAELVGLLQERLPLGVSPGDWESFVRGLNHTVEWPRGEVPRLSLRRAHTPEPLADELDELSLTTSETAVLLPEHGRGVGARAEAVATAVGIPEHLVEVLARAGRFHDVGKADDRFQRWLAPETIGDGLVAKSNRARALWDRDRIAAGWPRGGRHEALSGRLVQQWIDATGDELEAWLRDLLVHLVVTHHGRGRPLIVPVEDPTSTKVEFELDGVSVAATGNLSYTDWSQPRRFRDLTARFGHWGVALLEAVVRQADHAVSAGGWAPGEEII